MRIARKALGTDAGNNPFRRLAYRSELVEHFFLMKIEGRQQLPVGGINKKARQILWPPFGRPIRLWGAEGKEAQIRPAEKVLLKPS